jgi:Flp pilus assembly protein TadG
MSHLSFRSIRRKSSNFLPAREGNVALLAGFLLLPLLLGVGVGVDYARKGNVRSAVQEAADAAILRVARMKALDPRMSNEELTERAREIFDKSFKRTDDLDISSFRVAFDPAAEGFSLEIEGAMPTTLLGVAGVHALDLDTFSAVKFGKPPYMEMALVLDNTGSMNSSGKLAAAKSAAADLARAVLAVDGTDSKVALVPFSQYVNVGANGKGKFWMEDSGKSKRQNGVNDDPDASNSGGNGQGGGNGGHGGQGGQGGGAPDMSVAAADLAAEPKLNTWKGCVGSRSYPSNTENSDFFAKPVPEIYDGVCPGEIQPLTSDKPLILTKIEGMTAQGNTYIAGGLEWGWHVLTNETPFREGVTREELVRRGGVKYLVVLTDGENTRAPDYPTHNSSDRTLANSLTSRLCEQIKKDDIIVYAVAFGVTDSATHALLESCASARENYFAADDSEALSEAFAAIAASVRQLILTR